MPSAITWPWSITAIAVRKAIGLVEVLRGQQHGRPLRHQLLDHVPQREPAAGVKARGGLVEEQDGRLGDERRGEVEPAPHPAGVGLDGTARRVDQVEALEQRLAARPCLAARHAVEPADHRQVLEPRQVLVDGRVLAGESDLLAQLGRVADHVEAGDGSRSAVRLEQRGENPHERRLAGAVGAEQPEHGPARDVEIDVAQRPNVAERLRQPARTYRRPGLHDPTVRDKEI